MNKVRDVHRGVGRNSTLIAASRSGAASEWSASADDDNDDEKAAANTSAQLTLELGRFPVLSQRAGLPWLDKQMYHDELLHRATVVHLPRIAKLNRILSTIDALADEARSHCKIREALISKLLMTCAFEHSHAKCSNAMHRDACEWLKCVDDETDHIVRLVMDWRQALSWPLPFMINGENYLMRMATQIEPGKGLAHLGAHLRSTCRHLPFYYASSFDPMVLETNRVLLRKELFVLRDELSLQMQHCEEALRLARMGVYQPVLKFRHRLPHSGGGAGATRLLMVTNKRWKEQLVLSFANGLATLAKSRPVQDLGITAAMLQFAGLATKVLHKRYFLIWLEFRRRKVEKRRAVDGMLLMADMMLLQRYYAKWLRRRDRVLWLQRQYAHLAAVSISHLRRRYMQKLFLKAATRRAERLIQKAAMLRVFRALHFRAVNRILAGMKNSHSDHSGGGDDSRAIPLPLSANAHVQHGIDEVPWAARMSLLAGPGREGLKTVVGASRIVHAVHHGGH